MSRLAGLTNVLMTLLVVTGCGSSYRVIVLQHPTTKQTVHCTRTPSSWLTDLHTCVRGYEKAGYIVVGDSDK